MSTKHTTQKKSHLDVTEDRNMIAIRQIHEHLANVIEVPAELRNRRTEVIFLAIDSPDAPAEVLPDGAEISADKFFGSLPEFPERAPQGEFETRLELQSSPATHCQIRDTSIVMSFTQEDMWQEN
jgi:hypothetical protein